MPGAQPLNWAPLGKAWGPELLPLKNLVGLASGMVSSSEFGRFGVPNLVLLKNLEALGSQAQVLLN